MDITDINTKISVIPFSKTEPEIFAILIGLITGIWFKDFLLGFIIAFAMLFNLILAGTFGAAIPLILSYFKVDPAVAATVLLTTITDILGFVIFLALANYLLI